MLVTLISFIALLLLSLLETMLAYAHCLLSKRMSPHLTSSELDQVLEWKGQHGTNEIHNMLAEQRTREWGAADVPFSN